MASEQETEHIHNWSSRRTDLTHAYGLCRTCGVRGKRLLNQSAWEVLLDDENLTPLQRLQRRNIVLYRTNVELEQHLAELREENERLKVELFGVREESKSFQETILHVEAIMVDQAQQLRAARALLVRISDALDARLLPALEDRFKALDEIRAFLAEHKE